MIPRYQRVLFWVLLACCIAMSGVLLHLRHSAHERLAAAADKMPLNPPAASTAQDVTMMMANDDTGVVTAKQQKFALPADKNARARVVLQHLIADYAMPNSQHPIGSNSGVTHVFFLPVSAQAAGAPKPATASEDLMAVVDLSGSFAAAHPSGIETETLTLLSIIGTLHANFPQVTEVRFLVDGEPRDTLAGHADLRRIYLAGNSTSARHL